MLKTTADIRAYIAYYSYSQTQITETIKCYEGNANLAHTLRRKNASKKLTNALHRAINDELLHPIPTHWRI